MSTLLFDLEPQHLGAPKLIPKVTDGKIDVVNNFRWTVSPKGAIQDVVPFATFEEHELSLNSLITGAIYKVRGGIDNFANFQAEAARIRSYITRENLTAALTEEQRKEISIARQVAMSKDPYKGLYVTKKTGWSFNFPYLEPFFQSINNSWGDNPGGKGGGGMANLVGGLLGKSKVAVMHSIIDTFNAVGELANTFAPGSFAESSKFFNPSGGGESYTIRFPLLNTFDVEDIQKNWELCYILSYQNLPNRRSINLLDPPSLYMVKIPGIRYTPIGYISGLKITNVGNLRYVTFPGIDGQKPIPEAWTVEITITELITHSKNIMQTVLTDDLAVVATVTDTEAQQLFEKVKNTETVQKIMNTLSKPDKPNKEEYSAQQTNKP